jgi:hypothetical protein
MNLTKTLNIDNKNNNKEIIRAGGAVPSPS